MPRTGGGGEISVIRDRIMAYMAGSEAEVVFFGNRTGRDSDDREKIARMFHC